MVEKQFEDNNFCLVVKMYQYLDKIMQINFFKVFKRVESRAFASISFSWLYIVNISKL